MAFIVERNEEQVQALQRFQHVLPDLPSRHRVAQGHRQPLQNGCLQQEVLDIIWLLLKHLLKQVIQNIALATGERPDKMIGFLVGLQRHGDHLQCGCPALRARFDRGDMIGRERDSQHLIEQGCDLGVVEAQIGGPQFDNLPAPA